MVPDRGATTHSTTAALGLTQISLGCAQLGNLYRPIDEREARATVDAAWSEGIRYFDTAPHYGLGLSERRLGRALAAHERGDYVLSTKVGRLLMPTPAQGRMDDGGFAVPASFRRVWDFSRDGVLRSLEESLARLSVDRVDIVYLHDPDDHRDDAFLSAYPALEELRSQGVVTAIGAGMNQTPMLADFARNTDVDVVMLAGRYTLLDQSALDDLLPTCADRGVAVVAAGVFNSGLLARPRQLLPLATTTERPRRSWSTGQRALRRSASGTARRSLLLRSPSRSPTRLSSASASAPTCPSRSCGTPRSAVQPSRARSGSS